MLEARIANIRKNDELFCLKKNYGKTIFGMTFRRAGNFQINNSQDIAIENAKKVLKIIGAESQIGKIPIIAIGAHNHTDLVLSFADKQNKDSSPVDYYECDGVIYRDKGASIFYPGGCAAVVFSDKEANLTGILHGGWKPITKGIIANFILKWEQAGGAPKSTLIDFLPAICDKCLTYDWKYFRKNILPYLIDFFINIKCEKNALHEARNQAEEFYVFREKNKKVSFLVNFLIEHLLRKKKYFNFLTGLEDCTCHSGEYWCYRCDDKNGEKHRNAAFVIKL